MRVEEVEEREGQEEEMKVEFIDDIISREFEENSGILIRSEHQ
jgi:hypothetical protein